MAGRDGDQLVAAVENERGEPDRAEATGLVRREPDPHDRRANQIVLTAAGQAVVDQFAPLLEQVLQRLFHQTLAPSEIDLLVSLLQRVETAAREIHAAAR